MRPGINSARPSRFLSDLVQILIETRKTLLRLKALATFCEVLVELLLDLIKNLQGLAEFLLGLTIHLGF